MREMKLEPDVIAYCAVIGACGKGEQWQRALALFNEMREATLEPNVMCYNAGASACATAGQWQWALALLSEMWETRLEPDVIQLQRWDQRVPEWRAVAAVAGAAQRDVGGEGGAQRPLLSYSACISACESGEQWQRALTLLGEMWEAKVAPNVISYNALIGASGKSEQWQLVLALLGEMRGAAVEPDVIFSYNSVISACKMWQRALVLFREMWEVKLQPMAIITYNVGISACATGEQWQRALSLFCEMRAAKVEPDAILLQHWDQRLREGLAMAAGVDFVQRDAAGDRGARPLVSYSTGISLCEKGLQLQRAVALLSELVKATSNLTSSSYIQSTTLSSARTRRADSGSGL
ncbi:unnamed protein product [Prorocentrum cordatum]|uniref:Pentacotripeptide-repeat region of PRORP domain-containing protein n=1 Tax=Prorocentrum cordatum TaxID=2364126 RepID=A0ABN9QHJ5_9DINO|nr:unnamed protein product [Polarella glacialis]